MKAPNRNLLVLTGRLKMNQQEFEYQVELLNDLLFHVENMNAFCIASELIDVNKNKIIQKSRTIRQAIRYGVLKPFVFINCKN